MSDRAGSAQAGFVRVWLTGYVNPARMVEALARKPAPHWGLYGQLGRAALDSLALYLPLALLGREPSTPSYLSFLPTVGYYAASVFFMPVFLLAQWLLLSVTVHGVLRLAGRRGDVDQILNVTGMAALVVGTALVVWDWGYILLGGQDPVFLGISHLVLDVWAIVITAIGFRRLLGVPTWLGLLLNLLWMALGVPLAMLLVRAPV
jgi:hypothetical protein